MVSHPWSCSRIHETFAADEALCWPTAGPVSARTDVFPLRWLNLVSSASQPNLSRKEYESTVRLALVDEGLLFASPLLLTHHRP